MLSMHLREMAPLDASGATCKCYWCNTTFSRRGMNRADQDLLLMSMRMLQISSGCIEGQKRTIRRPVTH